MANWWEGDELVAPAVGKTAPEKTANAEKLSALEEVGRQLGLTLRAGVQSAVSIPAMMSDAVTGPLNASLDAILGKEHGFRFERASSAVGNLMSAAGVPEPKNAQERVVQDITSGMGGAASLVKAGQVASKAAEPVVAAVGKQFASGPGLQVVSGAAGPGAAGVVRENGGGEVAQTAAGLAGALTPGFAGPAVKATGRGLLRGGESGRQTVQKNIETFEAAGMSPSLGQATEGRWQRAAESALSRLPGGAGVMVRKAEQQAEQMAATVQKLADELAPGASAVGAGEAIVRGMQGFKQGFKDIQARLYDTLDKHIPEGTPITVGNTEFALKQLNADIPGAPNLSELFKNARIKGIDRALYADLEQAGAGTLPYEAVKKLRTLVGNEIADSSFASDVPRSKWKPLYGALSEDLGEAAKKAGPQAEQSWQWANTFTKTQLARMEELSGILSKDAPEKVFTSAISGTSEGDTIVRRIVSAIPKSERRNFAAGVLQRMGRAKPGQQNAEGDAFSTETFLTNLSKLSGPARQTIFGRTDVKGIEAQIGELAKVSENIRVGSKVFGNPSGTAQAISLKETAAGAGLALATGNPSAAAAALAVPATAYGTAKAFTSPAMVNALARKTTVAPGAIPSAVDAAGQIGQAQEPQWWHADERVTAPGETPAPSATPAIPAPSPQSAIEPDPIAKIASAANVDDAIAGAFAAIDGAPAVAPASQPVAVQNAPMQEPVSQVSVQQDGALVEAPIAANEASGTDQPTSIWTGRRGAGYLAAEDALTALKTRQKVEPNLDWRVERMPDEKFRLAGYARADGPGLMESAEPQTQPLQVQMNPTGTATVSGDPASVIQRLQAAGITKFLPTPRGVLVGVSQARQAMQLAGAAG